MAPTIRVLAFSSLLFAAPFASGSAIAEEEMPAVAVSEIGATIATVEEINLETREVKLRDPDGTVRTIYAGESIKDLDQVKRGDVVLSEFYQGFAMALAPKGSGIEMRRDEVDSGQADDGGKPAAVVTKTTDVIAVVKKVDAKNRTVTVQGAENTLVLKASDDVDLENVKVGQEVLATYIAAYAFAVVPAPKVSGTVELESKAVAAGIGISWGTGTLTMYDGSVHKLKVGGLSVGDIGMSSVSVTGEVYKLVDPQDFAGTYIAAVAGATMGKQGGSNVVLRNSKGVIMHVKTKQEGVRLSLGTAGITVEIVK